MTNRNKKNHPVPDDRPAQPAAELLALHQRALELSLRMRTDALLLADLQRDAITVLARLQTPGTPAPPPTPDLPRAPRLIRIAELSKRVALSRSSLWRMVKDGEFPRPRRLSSHAVAWLESEIEEWIRTRQTA